MCNTEHGCPNVFLAVNAIDVLAVNGVPNDGFMCQDKLYIENFSFT